MFKLSKEWLRNHCREQKLYLTPALNETLHLHFKGFTQLEALEEYTGLKALFCEGNGLFNLDGLSMCRELRCLFAQQNCLSCLEAAHLAPLELLDTLNVSSNQLSTLEGVQVCHHLATLNAAGNKLHTLEGLRPAVLLPLLTSLDITRNDLDGDGEALVALLGDMVALRALYLQDGNPICSCMRPYRKRVVSCLRSLCYLDDRPVFEAERRGAEAWARGGDTAEAADLALLAT